MDKKGGRYSININGRRYAGRAEARIQPTRASTESGVNWDGSGFSTVAPQLARIELTFDRGSGLPWTEAQLLNEVDVTFTETDANVTHYLTKGNWSGRPEINTRDGEVSGMALESDQYRTVFG